MLNKLTKDQVAKLEGYRDKWLAIGLCTKRADRKACEALAADLYKAAGLKAPKRFIWLDSPLQGAYAAHILTGLKNVWAQVRVQVGDQVRDQVGAQVGAQVGDQVRDQVGAQVRDQVGDQVWAQVRDQVGAQVGDQVRDQVRDQVGAQVRDQVGAQVGDQVRDQVGDQVWVQVGDQVYRCGYGSHDAGWLSFYDYFLNECDIKDAAKLNPQIALAKQCGWWWPFKDLVIFTEKPTSVSLVDKKLHSISGPAVGYADGFNIYAANGKRKGTLLECVMEDRYGKGSK